MPTSACAGPQANPIFINGLLALDVQLIYEDAKTGARARQVLERLAEQLKLEAELQVNLLRFDLLGEPELSGLVGDGGSDADILVLAAHGQSELPAPVRAWLDRWLGRRLGSPRALAVSLDAGTEGTAPAKNILASLQAAARLAAVEVFPHFGGTPTSDLTFEDIQYRAETKTALLEESLQRVESHSHWGLNE